MKITKYYVLEAGLVLIGLIAPRAVRADSFVTFQASGTFANVGCPGCVTTLAGNVTIDTTSGKVVNNSSFPSTLETVSNDSKLNLGPYNVTIVQGLNLESTFYGFTFEDSIGDVLYIALPTTSLVGYAGGAICSSSDLCPGPTDVAFPESSEIEPEGSFGPFEELSSGKLTVFNPNGPPTPTPEPSSLMMLGSSLLALVGARRWKLLA
jgi:hypothetical protein